MLKIRDRLKLAHKNKEGKWSLHELDDLKHFKIEKLLVYLRSVLLER
jgi:hypothetical protein